MSTNQSTLTNMESALWTLRNFMRDSKKDPKGLVKGEDLTLFRTNYSHAFELEATLNPIEKNYLTG